MALWTTSEGIDLNTVVGESSDSRYLRGSARGWLAAALLVTAAALFAASATSWFYADDFLNFALVREKGFGTELLTTAYFQHFAPLHRALDYAVLVPLELSWHAGLGVMLAIWLLGVGGVWMTLRELRLPVGLAVALIVAYASSPVWVRLMQWWASGGHVIPGLAGTAITLGCALRWHRTRRAPMLVAVATAYAFALSAYSKPLLVVAYVGLTLWFVLVPSLHPRAWARHIAIDWPLIVVLGVVSAAYLLIIAAGGYGHGSKLAPIVSWVDYLRISWTRGVTPLLLGQWVPEIAPTLRNNVAIVVAQTALVLAVAASIALKASAWRAWAAYGVMWVANVAIIGYARLADFGPGIGHDPRYQAEFTLVFVLTLALAFRPVEADGGVARPLMPQLAARAARLGVRMRECRRLALTLITLAGLAWATSVATAYNQLNDRWPARDAHAWADRVLDSITDLRRDGLEPTILDGPVPQSVVPGGAPPFNSNRSVLGVIAPDILIDSTRRDAAPAVIEEDGTVRLLRLQLVRSSSAKELEARNELTVLSGSVRRAGAGDPLCVAAPATGAALIEWRPSPIDSGGRLFATAAVPGDDGRGQVWVYLNTTGAYPIGPNQTLPVPMAPGLLRIDPMGGSLRAARLDVQAGGRMCLSRLSLYTVG